MFEYKRRVGMRDVDAAGILFFARYLSLVHEAYEEMFAQHGVSFSDQIEQHNIILPIVHVEADYRQPLAVDDTITINLAVADIGRRAYTVKFRFIREDEKLAAEGKIIHACVDFTTRRAIPLPPPLVTVLESCA